MPLTGLGRQPPYGAWGPGLGRLLTSSIPPGAGDTGPSPLEMLWEVESSRFCDFLWSLLQMSPLSLVPSLSPAPPSAVTTSLSVSVGHAYVHICSLVPPPPCQSSLHPYLWSSCSSVYWVH